ncbi:hypothetical protein OKA04_20940 [Luteolibacter flavescens]|uniref:Uncharacterized protein n=1 Tax=Luteolibacter flavescens TaxID=1859460 RepID=A0ABT3FUF8_9BACT|nr:hypothetical protein [Luteolibacter flavescens]MCW1887217.1 hypothetical protein [Luteolibacter flavescens]
MKLVLLFRVVGVLLVASQFTSCAWLADIFKGPGAVMGNPGRNGGGHAEPPTRRPPPSRNPDELPKPNPEPIPGPNPRPEPEPQPQPQPNPKPAPKPPVPTARPVPGKPGFVFSPFNNKLIDVEGMQSGRLVADPHYPAEERMYFRVP